jgi:hypothetical protein
MNAARRCTTAALALLGTEIAWVLITRRAWLSLGGVVTPWGLAARLMVVAVLLVVRLHLLVPRDRRGPLGRLVLALLLLPSVGHFHFVGPRFVGDGMMYYVYVRSIWKDGDLDFANEYAHYGLLTPDRRDLRVPTATGLRRSIFSIGPAVLWSPFFLVGEGVARAQAGLGQETDLSGYGLAHWNSVALGSLLYGFAAVWLIHELLRRYFSAGVALGSAVLIWTTTFLYWYAVQQPTYAHALSAFLVALVLWLWERCRNNVSSWDYFVWGLALGLAMCVRWQNGVFLLLPAFEFVGAVLRVREPAQAGGWLRAGGGLSLGVLLGVLPQLVAWKVIFGEWLLRQPPHGAGFLRLDHPYLLLTLFSSRHGLLSWTPVLWAGYLGFVPLLRARRALALRLLAPLLVMTYVNACSGDWWAGASFSNRRFDSCLPLFAFGIAASVAYVQGVVRRRPGWALTLALAPFVGWNLALMPLAGASRAGSSEPVTFTELVERTGRWMSQTVGSPPTWPASWVFALTYRCPPDQYDRLAGRYLFYRQNNLGGRIEMGAPEAEPFLAEGWGPLATEGSVRFRRLQHGARLFATLDTAEDLEVSAQWRTVGAGCPVALRVNGSDAGQLTASPEWSVSSVEVRANAWQREINSVELVPGDCAVDVAEVRFRQQGRR